MKEGGARASVLGVPKPEANLVSLWERGEAVH